MTLEADDADVSGNLCGFVLVIFGMSLGWIVKRKSIQGSCGGISSIGMEKVCDCPEPCDARKTHGARAAAHYLSFVGRVRQSRHPAFLHLLLNPHLFTVYLSSDE
jgi:hypothetical protein